MEISLKICSQCLDCSAGLASSLSSGRYSLKLSISSLSLYTTRSSLLALDILWALLTASSTVCSMSSMSSGFSTSNLSSSQLYTFFSHTKRAFHVLLLLSSSFCVRETLLKSSCGIEKSI